MTTDNPIALLRNEHTALLGQLHLLEQGEETGQKIPTLLRTIIRDSTVHFKRETLLFKALMSTIGSPSAAA